jgi:ABC-type glycerol-3-phosphate transport system permease component
MASVAKHTVMLIAVLFALIPVIWAIKSSFTPTGEVIRTSLFSAPSAVTTQNYTRGVASGQWGRYFVNSFFVAVCVSAATIIASATSGYGFAKFTFRGRNLLFGLVLVSLMMPFQAIMIPLFVEVRQLGWLGTYQGLIIPGAVSAFGVFMMRQFMTAIPDELLEAARLDGCSEWGSFRRVVLPLARAPLAALGALTFLASWNNFLYPLLIVQSDDLNTVPLGLVQFRGPYGTDYGQILALSLLGAVPVILLFIFMRRQIIASFATSGLK